MDKYGKNYQFEWFVDPFYTRTRAYIKHTFWARSSVADCLLTNPYLNVCLSSRVLLCTHFSRANEKPRMDLICTGINSIKIYLHRRGSAVRQHTKQKIELDTEIFIQPRCMSWSYNGSDDGFSVRKYFIFLLNWPVIDLTHFFSNMNFFRRCFPQGNFSCFVFLS